MTEIPFPITEVNDDELRRVSQLLKALSPNARQFQATRGQLPLRWDALMNLWDTFLQKVTTFCATKWVLVDKSI